MLLKKINILYLVICLIFILCSCSNNANVNETTIETAIESGEMVTETTVKEINKPEVPDETTALETEAEVKESIETKDYDNVGDFLMVYSFGNINEGPYQWQYKSKNNNVTYYDEVVNFYDIESSTEVGEVATFFKATKEGEDILLYKLINTKTNTVYYEVEINLQIDSNKVMTLGNIVHKDSRPEALKEFKFDGVSLRKDNGEH